MFLSYLVDRFIMLIYVWIIFCILELCKIIKNKYMSLSELFRQVYYDIYVFVKVMYLCVFHYMASYCINTLLNSLHHILSTIYRCETSSFKFDN